jgi:HEAT repeat protein
MNRALRVAVLFALVIGIAGQALATDKVQVAPRATKELIAINLMNGLASDNKGVRESAAFMLGEEKITVVLQSVRETRLVRVHHRQTR